MEDGFGEAARARQLFTHCYRLLMVNIWWVDFAKMFKGGMLPDSGERGK